MADTDSLNDAEVQLPGLAAGEHNQDLRAIRRSVGLILMLLLAMTLYFAKDVILPLLLGTLLSLTLSPLVRSLKRRGFAPFVTALALILIVGVIIGGTVFLVSGPVSDWISHAPQLGAELRQKLQTLASSVAVVQEASDQVDQITAVNSDPTVQKVAIQSPGLLTSAVSNVMSVFAATLVTLVLALFLLASGDLFYVKLIDALPRFGDKKRALRIVYGIEQSVSHYLLTVTLINFGLGVVIGTAMALIGMPQPLVWAVVAFLLNYLPYLGPIFGAGLSAVVAIVTFDSLAYAALAPALYMIATSIEGQFLTPVILGRRLELNTVSVFVTLVFWGWLWGIAGAFMAVPFLVCLKVICDNVESMATLGNFLGAASPTAQASEEV